MAEFCLDCWNELNHTLLTEEDVILSEYLELCEGCEKMKQVIEAYRARGKKSKLRGAKRTGP